MHVFIDLLHVTKIAIEVDPLDTTEILKEKISEKTTLPISDQILTICQNGAIIELKNNSRIYLGNLVKSKTVITLSCKQNLSSFSFYIYVVTETGLVFTLRPEGGNSTRIINLKEQLSKRLSLSVESFLLRSVDMLHYVNKGLTPDNNTLEDFSVKTGAVLYVQIHPCEHNWFFGRIEREQAEKLMSSATDGQFLVKESIHFPGDYVLFVRVNGEVQHYRVLCKKNMMFTINGEHYCDTINNLVKFYQNNKGSTLPIKLTDPISKTEATHCSNGASLDDGGSATNGTLPRPRLETSALAEIHLQVEIGSRAYSLLANPFDQIQSLKEQIEELTCVSTDSQLLRWNDKPLIMNDFILEDYHIRDNSTIVVQVHPWNEEWYIGKCASKQVETGVKERNVADGMFLIRDSTSTPGNYCLHVWWKGKSMSYMVECKKGLLRIGSSLQFSSLALLVEYYRKHRGPLKTLLTEPVKFDKEKKGLIPLSFFARGSKARAAYNRALENGKTWDSRVRVMLIGESGAGKTSLKRTLKGEKFKNQEPSTQGIEVDPPLVKAGIKPWQNDEKNTVFDHKSALLVARQLSVETPTQPSPPVVRTNKSPQSASVEGSEEIFHFKPAVAKEVNGRASPCAYDDVFTDDCEPSDDVPPKIANLVKHILLQQQPSMNEDEEVWPVIWDFTGHFFFYALHRIFMSQEAVYVLVCDLSKDLFERTQTCALRPGQSVQPGRQHSMVCRSESSLDQLMKWMDLVHSFQDCRSVSSFGVAQPPVILVGSHADKVQDPWKAMNVILDTLHGKAFSCHIVDERFVVDNTCSGRPFQQEDPNIHNLRKAIVTVASTLPHIKREIPLQWLQVENELHCLSKNGLKHVTKAKFVKIADKICQFKVLEDCNQLLHFLCDCGAVLCFNAASGTDDLLILDPQWLIHVLCEIMSLAHHKNESIAIRQHRQTLAKEGILSEELVSSVCQVLGLKISKECLLSIMEQANLVCRWDVPFGKPIFFVPSMLTAQPEQEISKLNAHGSIAPVYLTFNTGYIPYGLFARFLVMFGQWASREHSAKAPKLFANVARFFIGKKSDFTLVFVSFKSVIAIHLVHEVPEEGGKTAAVCQEICSCIEDILCKLRKECPWMHSMSWQLSAQCDLCLGDNEGPGGCSWHGVPTCRQPDCAHFIPLGQDPLQCTRTRKLNTNTRLDERKLKPWLKHFTGSHYPELLPYKQGLVSLNDRLLLARDLGVRWVQLCRILLDDVLVMHIDQDNDNLFDKCFATLNQWGESQGSKATYTALGMALMHKDLQFEDLCKQYCLESQQVLESSV